MMCASLITLAALIGFALNSCASMLVSLTIDDLSPRSKHAKDRERDL